MENFDDKYKKKNPFTVPEGYFDELTGRITGGIEKQKEVKKSSSLRGLKPYMGLVALSCFNGGSDSISRSEEY